MRFDLDLVAQLSHEVGLWACTISDQRVDVDLGHGTILTFQNDERDEHCLFGILDSPWHVHDKLMSADPRGYHVELDYLDVLTGLAEGRILICEQQSDGKTLEISLIHSEYNDEFRHLAENERLIVRRAVVNKHLPDTRSQ
jgi:hypothetical protein